MALSAVSICNIALARIGIDQTIESLDDTSTRARMCKLFYEPCRDQLLRDGVWRFASTVVAGAMPSGDAPPGWAYQYAYPSDALKIIEVGTSAGLRQSMTYVGFTDPWTPTPVPKAPFDIMASSTDDSRIIVTDVAEAYIWYTKKVTDPNTFDPLFQSALAWKLAGEIALPLKAKADLSRNAMEMAQGVQSMAQAAASNEQSPDMTAVSPSISGRL